MRSTERQIRKIAAMASLANRSQHLQMLRSIGLVRVPPRRYAGLSGAAYRASRDLWRCLGLFGEKEIPMIAHLVDIYVTKRHDLRAISASELRGRLQQGGRVLLAVQMATECAAGHIPWARSLPIHEQQDHLDELPDDSEIVSYCRGRYCVYAEEAARPLREHGFRARRPEPSVGDYRRASGTPHRTSRPRVCPPIVSPTGKRSTPARPPRPRAGIRRTCALR